MHEKFCKREICNFQDLSKKCWYKLQVQHCSNRIPILLITIQILKELFQALKSGWLLFVVFRLASQLLHGCKRSTLFPLFYQKMHCRQKYCKNRSRREREATIRGLTCLCRGTHKSGRLVRIYSLALFRAFHVVRLTLCMLMGIFKMPYAYLKSKEISKPHQGSSL